MKTPSAILLTVIVAAAAAFVTYKLTIKGEVGTSYVFQTPQCGFVKLKIVTTEAEAVKAFEDLLMNTVDPKAEHGTTVNIRFLSEGKPVEDAGPSMEDGKFHRVVSNPNCPDGSMHNTQRVNASNQKDYKAVIDSLDFSTTSTTSSPATPTSTP